MPLAPVHTKGTTKVVTGEVRLSYAHLFEKHAGQEGNTPKYGVCLLIPKSDKATIAAIEDAQQVALEAGKVTKFGGKIPPNWKNTFRDGDLEADLDKNPEYEGHMFLNVSSDTQPGIVDRQVNPILDSTEVYSGCFARVEINAFAFNNQSKGVSFGLNHVQKLRDGEPFGNITRPEDAFEPLDDEPESDESLLG